MQVFRKDDSGLQVAWLELVAPGKARFPLYPMIHIGDRAFFERVKAEADAHDAVLGEGVYAKPARLMGRLQGLAKGGRSRFSALADIVRSNRENWYHGDMEGDGFQRGWAAIPLWRRALMVPATAVMSLVLRSRRARRWFAEALGDGDLDPHGATERIGGREFRRLVVDDRDAALAAHCESMMEGWEGARIAVVWGAAHIGPLADHLIGSHGYQVERCTWMAIVAL